MYRTIKVSKGVGGWGGPLILVPDDKKNKVLSVTSGGIHPLAQKLADMSGTTALDGFTTGCPDEEVLVAIVDCGGTARCGVYPKKKIKTINLNEVGKSGPLASFMTEDYYVSGVTEKNLEYVDPAAVKTLFRDEEEVYHPKTKDEAKREVAAMREKGIIGADDPAAGKSVGILTKLGIGVGKIVNKFFSAGRESIDSVIRNILPFMAFTSTVLGIITVSGLGEIIANTVAPFCSTLPGMLLISVICALPFLSPVLGPGAVIAQVVGTLLGAQFALGHIPPQYALPALFAIDAQVGCDFIPVGLSLGEAEPETIEMGVPAVLYSRVITGPLSVLIAFVFSIGLYS